MYALIPPGNYAQPGSQRLLPSAVDIEFTIARAPRTTVHVTQRAVILQPPLIRRGVGGTLRMIVHKEGVRGLYRGLTVSLIKAAPASAVTMWTYERAMRGFEAWEARNKDA